MSKTTSKRVKEVFKSSEIAHIWAHRGAPKGRCASSMTFEGETFYSYCTPIARLIKAPDGSDVAVLNQTSYSVTTSSHFGDVRSAVRHLPCFYVGGLFRGSYSGVPSSGEELVSFYLRQIEESESRPEEPSRYRHINAARVLARLDKLTNAQKAAEFFGQSKALKLIGEKLRKLQSEADEAEKIACEHEDKRQVSREKRKATQEANRKITHAAEIACAITRAEKFIAGNLESENGRNADWFGFGGDWMLDSRPDLLAGVNERRSKLAANAFAEWHAGSNSPHVTGAIRHADLLRREGEEIVTSKGARIPVEHARKAFALVKRQRDKHEAWHHNGSSIHVGHYTIDSIDADGTVRAGCHVVPWNELNSLAVREGWLRKSTLPIRDEATDLSLSVVGQDRPRDLYAHQ